MADEQVRMSPRTGKPVGKARGKPFVAGDPRQRPKKKGTLNKVTRAAKEFAKELLDDPEYQQNLAERIKSGKASSVETYMWSKIVGPPKQEIEITTHKPLFQLDTIPSLVANTLPEEPNEE